MSESVAQQGAEVAANGPTGPTAGMLLAQLRESTGVHIDALAGALKVPVSRLEALEADEYDSFPDAVFMRALAASVCRTLRADPAPILALLPHGGPIQLTAGDGINAAFKDQGRRVTRSGGASIDRPRSRLLGIAVAVLLVGALAVAFLPQGLFGGAEEHAAGSDAPAAPALAAAPEQAPSALQASPDQLLTVPQTVPAAPAEAASAATVPAVAASQPAVATSAGAAADGVLVIRARAPSWIQVRGASGAVVLEKTLATGDSVSAPGNAPWAVVIGRADATEVIVRGKPMDMSAVARSNVARFEVK